MNALLNQAIADLNLRPGQSFPTTVNGHPFEVKMLETLSAEATPAQDDEPSQFADMVMLEPWFTMPEIAGTVITVQRGEPMLPAPMVFDESDLKPE